MRNINKIIIHCSATSETQDIGVEEIRDWHVNGNGWLDCGYHYVIRRNGVIEDGRPIATKGAHARGYNGDSVGVCLVGGVDANNRAKAEANYTFEQYQALDTLAFELCQKYDIREIFGHNSVANKACPCFDVKAFFSNLTLP